MNPLCFSSGLKETPSQADWLCKVHTFESCHGKTDLNLCLESFFLVWHWLKVTFCEGCILQIYGRCHTEIRIGGCPSTNLSFGMTKIKILTVTVREIGPKYAQIWTCMKNHVLWFLIPAIDWLGLGNYDSRYDQKWPSPFCLASRALKTYN